MEAKSYPALNRLSLICNRKRFSVTCNQRWKRKLCVQGLSSSDLRLSSPGRFDLGISHACKDSTGCALQPGDFCASIDGNRHWFLMAKGQEVASNLDGRCVFLVGMMGSGKTTVGKILAEALGYTFVDSDKYVEQVFGGVSVAEIFHQHGESFFRDNETEALQKLSSMPRQVIATGGGVVVRPTNWEYMKQGITIYLNVPLDALARRIAAVGTGSRPLLNFESGDPYTQAFMGLFTLSKKRVEAYSNADITVSLLNIADKMNIEDVSDLTPTAIAIQVLVQIEKYFRGDNCEHNFFL